MVWEGGVGRGMICGAEGIPGCDRACEETAQTELAGTDSTARALKCSQESSKPRSWGMGSGLLPGCSGTGSTRVVADGANAVLLGWGGAIYLGGG